MIYRLLLFSFLFLFSFFAITQDDRSNKKTAIENLSTIENKISFKQSLNSEKLEYQLKPISNGRFKLIFLNRPTEYVHIKIYDIIGNLILSEDNKYSINSEIEYNFNEKNNKIYVVKVEAGEDNLTKKVNF